MSDTLPVVLVDIDALIDMDAWHTLAVERRWSEFFSHISEAPARDNSVPDMLDLAKGDGCWIAYTCRWDSRYRDAVFAWMGDHDLPRGTTYMRMSRGFDPVGLALRHAQLVTEKTAGRRPVFVIHNDADIAAALRKRGVAALGVNQIPMTVREFRAILNHARPVSRLKRKEVR